MKDLKRKNFYYQSNKGKSFKVGMYEAAVAYTKWTLGELLDDKETSAVKEFIPTANWDVKVPWYDKFDNLWTINEDFAIEEFKSFIIKPVSLPFFFYKLKIISFHN